MDNEVVVSNRDKHLERMRKKYPDKKFMKESFIQLEIPDYCPSENSQGHLPYPQQSSYFYFSVILKLL